MIDFSIEDKGLYLRTMFQIVNTSAKLYGFEPTEDCKKFQEQIIQGETQIEIAISEWFKKIN